MGAIGYNGKIYPAGSTAAADSVFDNTGTGLSATNAEDAIKELAILAAIADGTYEGVDLTVKFADEIANYSDEWAWIQARLDAHNITGLHTCDYIPIKVGTETHKARIAGINTYLKTGGNGKVVAYHIDWITDDCYGGSTVQWNTTNTNQGTADEKNPFLASNLNTWLNSTLYNLLESKLKAVIKTKRMLMPTRYQSGASLTDDNSLEWKSLGPLWVPLECEIFDSIVWSTKGYGNGQAVQYPIFRNSYRFRMKNSGPNGSRAYWWTASAYSGDAAYAVIVDYGGNSNYSYASNSFYAPVCFRTMAAA